MIVYVDTSVLIKLVIQEAGSEAAAELWDLADGVVAAEIGYVEARAALAAARRDGRLSSRQLAAAKRSVEALWSQVAVVTIDRELITDAGRLAEEEALRGYDAVHLAAALLVEAEVVASADVELLAAARRQGLHVAHPAAQ